MPVLKCVTRRKKHGTAVSKDEFIFPHTRLYIHAYFTAESSSSPQDVQASSECPAIGTSKSCFFRTYMHIILYIPSLQKWRCLYCNELLVETNVELLSVRMNLFRYTNTLVYPCLLYRVPPRCSSFIRASGHRNK